MINAGIHREECQRLFFNHNNMEIVLNRIAKRDSYTIGKLYIDGKYVCDTCEDKDRGLTDQMSLEEIKQKKVYG